jgi:hypothetical protein
VGWLLREVISPFSFDPEVHRAIEARRPGTARISIGAAKDSELVPQKGPIEGCARVYGTERYRAMLALGRLKAK